MLFICDIGHLKKNTNTFGLFIPLITEQNLVFSYSFNKIKNRLLD